MYSMTGFGSARQAVGEWEVSIDVRTVNSRNLDILIRMPRELAACEGNLKRVAQERMRRGRVEVFVNMAPAAGNRFEWNQAAFDSYVSLAAAASERGIPGDLDIATLMQLPGVVQLKEADWEAEGLAEGVAAVLRAALDAAQEARRGEGDVLCEDLRSRCDTMTALLRLIDAQAAGMVEYYRERLLQKVQRLEMEVGVDPSRLAQEVAFLAERSDISEEITRLDRHLDRFRELLERGGDESVGKSLDFVCQELNRETNTILSKAQKPQLSEVALKAKTEVERIREQVQNVE